MGTHPYTYFGGTQFHHETSNQFVSTSMSVYLNQKLSPQAIYQQKLKQGVYHSPGLPTVGVNSSASDAAALLAASTDLTVKPSYERTVAAEAHTAAVAAKSQKPQPEVKKSSSSSGIGLGVPSFTGSGIYAAASRNSTMSMSTRTEPEKDYRSGLAPKAADASLNIHKISELATKNSSKSLNLRFNPELDYRSGLKQKPAEYLNQDEEDLAAEGAAASLKHGAGASDAASLKTRSTSFKASDVVGSTLLGAANARAQERLQTLSLQPGDFKAQAQAYANALAIAQKNSNERLKRNAEGHIDLGGGLTMTQKELDAMAALVVQPVLSDISTKASAQRDADASAKKKQEELVKKHDKAKQEEIERKLKEKAELEKAKKERLDANEARKEEERTKYADYQAEREEELKQKVAELKEKEAQYAEEKETLLAEKLENQARIDEEEQAKIDERKKELEEMQAEKDEVLKPVLEELEVETTKLKEVTDARDQLREEVKTGETHQEEYEKKVVELNEKLETVKADIEKYTGDLEESTRTAEDTSKEVDELHQQLADELKLAEDSHKELDAKIQDLETQQKDHLVTKKEQKQLILKNLDERVKEEHAINAELPEHMRKEVNEKKLRDVGDLFGDDEVPEQKPLNVAAKKEPKETTAPVSKVAPTSKPAVSSAKNEKKSGLKRFTKYFSSKPPKAAEPVPRAKSVKKEHLISEASNADFDDISSSNEKNKGGLFKEEI